MFFPFLFLFFVGCNERLHRGPAETEKQLVPKEAKSDFTGDVEQVGVEFRRILYEYEYPVPVLRRYFKTSNLDAKVLGVSLVKFLRIDPELSGLILEVFFRGWNYHVGAILTFLCRNSASKCASISEQMSATVYHRVMNKDNLDPGEFGNIIATIHKSSLNELLPKNLSDFDKTILWLNGEQNLQFSDRDVFVGLLRFIITDEFGINGFICLRFLEKKIRFANPQWIGAGELKLEGVMPSDIAKCQKSLLEMNNETREAEIYTIAHTISESVTIVEDEAKWATEFKKIIYTSSLARSDLRTFFLLWGEAAAGYILSEVLIRSIHVDSFLWEFVFQEIFRRTARGMLTARLTSSSVGHARRRRDADNMAHLMVTWTFRHLDGNQQEQWDRVYVDNDGGCIHWDDLSNRDTIMRWINGAILPARKRIADRNQVTTIIRGIVESQITSNAAICYNILKLGGNLNESDKPVVPLYDVRGDDILACQDQMATEIAENPNLVCQFVDLLVNEYFKQSLF